MSKARETKFLLQDMQKAVNKVLRFTENITYETFIQDEKTIDATLHNIQILGEAANQISEDFQEQNNTIEWTKIIRSRHILVHQYHEIDYEIIWKIVETYLPPLKEELDKLLSNFE